MKVVKEENVGKEEDTDEIENAYYWTRCATQNVERKLRFSMTDLMSLGYS